MIIKSFYNKLNRQVIVLQIKINYNLSAIKF